MLPFFLIFAFVKALFLCLTRPVKCIYLSDGLLSPLGYALKIATRKPTAVNIHGRDIAFPVKLYQLIIPWALRRIDKVICVSEGLKNECLKRNIPEHLLHIIPNGVNIDDFYAENNKILFDDINTLTPETLNNRKILITVGRLVRKKGVLYFLKNVFPKIISQYPDIAYLIVGDGPLENKIRKLIVENNLQKNAYLLGRIPMDSRLLVYIYNVADIFVMPNIPVDDDMEGFGIVALEAAAAGLPVVASNVDGIAEAVKDNQNGFLIDYNNHAKYTDTILGLLKDEAYRIEFGEKAKNFVKKYYDWSNISRKYLLIFESLFDKKPS